MILALCPLIHLYINSNSLNIILDSTRSQCNFFNVVEIGVLFLHRTTNLAAAFCTFCSLNSLDLLMLKSNTGCIFYSLKEWFADFRRSGKAFPSDSRPHCFLPEVKRKSQTWDIWPNVGIARKTLRWPPRFRATGVVTSVTHKLFSELFFASLAT